MNIHVYIWQLVKTAIPAHCFVDTTLTTQEFSKKKANAYLKGHFKHEMTKWDYFVSDANWNDSHQKWIAIIVLFFLRFFLKVVILKSTGLYAS